jgi:O-antigen/teichoic acid export membrane protein
VLGLFAGTALTLLSNDILTLFYSSSAQDIVILCDDLVKYFGFTAVFYSLAGTAVFAVQAIGLPQKSIKPYVISGIIRVVLNVVLIKNERLILLGAVISGAVGYFVMWVWNVKIVCKYSKTKFKFFETVAKPAFVALLTYFLSYNIFLQISAKVNIIYKLLIEILIFTLIFCILCLMCKVLKFSEIFSTKKFKKNGLNA